MKISLAISALILAAATGLGWKIDGKLTAARADERNLAAEAARFGISAGDAHSTRSAKRVRVDNEAEAGLLTTEYIQLAKISEKGGQLDEASQLRYRDCWLRISALDASSLKILIAGVLACPELNPENRAERVIYLLRMVIAKKDPRAALQFVMEHAVALKDAKGIEDVISDSLGSWAKDDPVSAVQWMKNNATEFPDAMKAQSLHNVFHSAAGKDPGLAFTLIAGLGLNASDSHGALHNIVTAAATDEQRNTTLAALREFRDTHKSEKEISQAAEQMVGYFSWGFKEDGFNAATRWIASANLTPKELDRFCGQLTRNYDGDEHAQWIEWIGGNFPPGKGDGQIMDIIGKWTERDYEAAGKWLASAPEGPAKNAAICGYAQTVFKHDPETAMQWIMTLPPGKYRDATLQNIHANWPKDDPAGRAAFAEEHGIK